MNLDKKIEQFSLDKHPQLLDLSKKAATIADKYGLGNKPARVSVLLDYSGSMEHDYRFYSSGQVQQLMTRLAALGVLFDDDGQIDIFPFHNSSRFYKSVSPLEATSIVKQMQRDLGDYGGTNYGNAFKAFHDHYWPQAGSSLKPYQDGLPPVYVIFITDGATDQKEYAIKMIELLSYRPCFVQTIALGYDYDSNKQPAKAPEKKGGMFGGLFGGGSSSGSSSVKLPGHLEFLAKLDDDLNGYVDALDFFGTKTPTTLSEEEFFERMMGEYPQWLANPKVFGPLLGQSDAKKGWA